MSAISDKEIHTLAKKAGLAQHGLGWTAWESQLERFARAVAEAAVAAERAMWPEHLPDATKMVVPEGWKLVPVEPTAKMRKPWKELRGYSWHDKYKAMLAAAPEPKK